MAGKAGGSRIGRIVDYFRTGNMDEVEVVFVLVERAISGRRTAHKQLIAKQQKAAQRTLPLKKQGISHKKKVVAGAAPVNNQAQPPVIAPLVQESLADA